MNWLEREVPSLELCKELREVGYPQDTDGYLWTNAKKVWLCGEDSWQITEEFYLANEKPYYPLGGIPQTDWAKKQRDDWYSKLQMYKAPTCRELGELLPFSIMSEGAKFVRVLDLCFAAYVSSDMKQYVVIVRDNTEPNIRAKMVIWLKQHDYIDFKDGASFIIGFTVERR